MVIASFLDQISFFKAPTNNQLFLAATLNLNIMLLPTPLYNFYGYNLYYENLVFPSSHHLPHGTTTSKPPSWLPTQCFIEEQNILKLIFHFVYDLVASNALYVKFIPSRDQLINTFTKSFSNPKFSHLWCTFNVRELSLLLQRIVRQQL